MALNFPSLQSLASGLPAEVQQALRSALAAQDKFNREVAQAFAGLSQWTWQTPQLLNGWGSGVPAPSFTQLATGQVVLHGRMLRGTVGSPAYLLPVAMRPLGEVVYAANSGTALGIIVVDASGTVRPVTCPAIDIHTDFTFLGGA